MVNGDIREHKQFIALKLLFTLHFKIKKKKLEGRTLFNIRVILQKRADFTIFFMKFKKDLICLIFFPGMYKQLKNNTKDMVPFNSFYFFK